MIVSHDKFLKLCYKETFGLSSIVTSECFEIMIDSNIIELKLIIVQNNISN